MQIGGISIQAIRQQECVEHVMQELDEGRGGWIATANIDHLRRLRTSQEFVEAYNRTSIVVADGMPLVWASRLQGTPLPERVAGSDLINSLSQAAAKRGHSVFLLGGNPGAAESAADVLMKEQPGLRIAGTSCPPVGFDRDPAQMEALRQELAESGADVVYVALGSPKQELFIDRIREALPNAWWIGVGISFSFVCGEVHRAPGWMQRCGFEWLHRLVQEPRRLAGRYLFHGTPFAARLMLRSMWRRFAPSARS
ncbi:MAG: WecB/TagA/CpsF family glycosyltransferase [Planctomycetota bacterium]